MKSLAEYFYFTFTKKNMYTMYVDKRLHYLSKMEKTALEIVDSRTSRGVSLVDKSRRSKNYYFDAFSLILFALPF